MFHTVVLFPLSNRSKYLLPCSSIFLCSLYRVGWNASTRQVMSKSVGPQFSPFATTYTLPLSAACSEVPEDALGFSSVLSPSLTGTFILSGCLDQVLSSEFQEDGGEKQRDIEERGIQFVFAAESIGVCDVQGEQKRSSLIFFACT